MSDEGETSRDGEGAGFSQTQLSAISSVVERLLEKALSERDAVKAVPSGDGGPGSSCGTAPGEREWSSRA